MVADAEIPIIHPPPEVKNIVDKTAGFVARNGVEFETRIKQVNVPRKKALLILAKLNIGMPCHNNLQHFSFQNEINNPKFNFLNPGDPYHAYYKHKVVVIR